MNKVYIIMEQIYSDNSTENLHSIYLNEIDAARKTFDLNAEVENSDSFNYYYIQEEVKCPD